MNQYNNNSILYDFAHFLKSKGIYIKEYVDEFLTKEDETEMKTCFKCKNISKCVGDKECIDNNRKNYVE